MKKVLENHYNGIKNSSYDLGKQFQEWMLEAAKDDNEPSNMT